ncbi:FtsK/SpoIIIE domain-containing protein [Arthrobacter sp. VKM Ac-2550]|uniref:FtsK/SpoIIIE domain-containing protein n=1 Tax=Crystallibacter permensis TaxID=1938888 RepID=UPI0022267245|nr:FtsK/SpoIIIE domain-containing protein [Arthrobacter sp. VKM Ac-2550]MCW2135011.1 hypothetical protein [Arthrobacter sp. VKM Ac-2550]
MAARAQAPQKPVTLPLIALTIAAAGAAIWYGYPGLALVWAGLTAAGITYPPAQFTGKKDKRGYATPADASELPAMNRYRFWEDVKYKLMLPNADWLPGWPVRLSWLAALWAGAAASLIPVTDEYTTGWGQWVNAAAAYVIVAQLTASRRRTCVYGDESPGARTDTLIRLFKERTAAMAGMAGGGAALGIFLAVAATIFEPLYGRIVPIPVWALWLLLPVGGILLVISRTWIDAALEHWKVVVEARAEWENRWPQLKIDPAPRLIDRQQVGPATVDTFEAPASMGAGQFWTMDAKITPTVGGNSQVYVLDVPDSDANGQPVAGSRSPLKFDIAVWPADQIPSVTDPTVPKEQVALYVRCALAKACDAGAMAPRYIFDDIHLLTEPAAPAAEPVKTSIEGQIVAYGEDLNADGIPDGQQGSEGSPAVWALTWHNHDTAGAVSFRTNASGAMAGIIQAQVLVDHRARGGSGVAYFGAIGDPAVRFDPNSGVTEDALHAIAEEDKWNRHWGEVVGSMVNPPIAQIPTGATETLRNGVAVHRMAFVTRQGMDPMEFMKYENKMPTVLNAAPFVTLTGWPGTGQRPGERHSQALAVYWSDESVPANPDTLPGTRGSEAAKWVLSGRVNQAFTAARLPRPEIARALCLTKEDSRKHIWKIDLRLYGGVTLAEVRGAAQKIKQHWASEWLRVTAAADGCTIYVGANPSKVKLANPRYEKDLHALDWEQAFLDAKISGIGGLMPKLVNVDHMPMNPQVKILTFDLTGTGLDFAAMKEVRARLESTSGNSFVDIRRVKNDAQKIQILASEVNPMPEHAPYDYEAIDGSKGIPFATGVEGEPVEFSIKDHIHQMVVGGSGSGKSVILQAYITGALRRGCDVYIADPTKGAADFTFAEPYAKAFCKDLLETGAMMKGVYDEVKRRVKLNSTYGVGSYRDLPEDVRPAHIVIVLDEFTSLIAPDAVAKPSDDPEVEAEREMALAINASKAEVGAFTAKIAREARSAGVTLLLATQKLVQKDLDQMPGGATLKDLDLDTLLPVPVSMRFPEGWARNRDLQVGDLLFAVDGSTTPIAGFSPVIDQESTWEVIFDDGQIVRTGAGHQWTASNESSRKWWGRVARDHDGNPMWQQRAATARYLSETLPVGTWADFGQVAEMAGLDEKYVRMLSTKFGTPVMTDTPFGLQDADWGLRRGLPGRQYLVDSTCLATVARDNKVNSTTNLEPFVGTRLTARQMLQAATGSKPTSTQAGNLVTRLGEAGVPWEQGEHDRLVIDSGEFFTTMADHSARMALTGADGDAPSLEKVVTTEQMAATLKCRRGGSNWAVRLSEPAELAHADLPVDPYVLGAWLGDGSTGTGIICAGKTEACTGADGITDQEHMIRQLTAAGYEGHALKCSDRLIGTYGLRVALRGLGVLYRKHIPADYLRASAAQRLALLQGLMDTDGTVGKGKPIFTQKNRGLALQVLELARSLGFKATEARYDSWYKDDDGERVMKGKVTAVAFHAGVEVFRLPRKAVKQKLNASRRLRYVVDVRRVDPVQTRCIAVEHPSHLFLVEGFIPTHNTNLSRLIAGKSTPGERMSALKDAMNAPSLGDSIPPGRAIFEPVTSGPVLIQCWYDKREQEALAEYVGLHRSPLAEDEKLDLNAYMRNRPRRDDPGQPEEPAVIDLGELELDLDDLELDWSDEEAEDAVEASGSQAPETDAGPTEPAAQDQPAEPLEADEEAVPAPVRDDRYTAALLDVDGVIMPFVHREGMISLNVPGHGTLSYRPEVVRTLSALPVRQAWLTSWGEDAPRHLGPMFPYAGEVLDAATEDYGWWKIDALAAWLDANPQVKRVVWADDELAGEDYALGLPFRELAGDMLADRGVEALLVVPDANVGLTAADLQQIAAFADGEATIAVPVSAAPAVVEEPIAVPEPLPWEEEAPVADPWNEPAAAPSLFQDAAPSRPARPDDDDPFAWDGPARRTATDEDPFAMDIPLRRSRVPDDDPFA